MSRPVKNLRFMGNAGNASINRAVKVTGKPQKVGSVTEADGRAHTGDGVYESQTKPHFNDAPKVLNKYDGH